jgi:chaperone LolA
MSSKRIFIGFSLAVAILLMATLPTEAISAKKILKKVDGEYKSLNDFRASFGQRISVDPTDTVGYAAAGTLWVKKPAKFRLQLEHQTVVSDGCTLWTYVPRNQQVLVDQADTTGGATRPDQLFLTYFKKAEAELVGTEEISGRDCYLLHLTPEESDVIVSLRVWVDQKTWLARRLEVAQEGGMITDYRFSDIQVNPGLPDSLFVFRAPPEVEVIDLRW